MGTTKEKPVKAKADAAKDLNELFLDSLKDIYWAENALVKALPTMRDNATSSKLAKGIDDHLAQTKEHVERLKEVFKMLDETAEGKKCEAMAGILKEGEEILKETEKGDVRDAGIIAACQKVEHYEIATYGTLVAWAEQLEVSDAAKVLLKTLKEEKAADAKLSKIATSGVNKSAEN